MNKNIIVKHRYRRIKLEISYQIAKHFRKIFRFYQWIVLDFRQCSQQCCGSESISIWEAGFGFVFVKSRIRNPDPREKHYKSCSLIVFMLVRLLLAGKSLPALSTREHDLKNAQSRKKVILYLRILRLFFWWNLQMTPSWVEKYPTDDALACPGSWISLVPNQDIRKTAKFY